VLATADRAFGYYSAVYNRLHTGRNGDWLWGTYMQGVGNMSATSGNSAYLQDVVAWAKANKFTPRPAQSNADSTKANTAFYDAHSVAPSLVPLTAVDKAMADNVQSLPDDNYSWIDALFMGMGNWPRAYARTHDEAYLQKMDGLFASSRDAACGAVGMYNPADGLWYRDCGFVGKTDVNRQPIYWSRGNGWVMGALAEVLQSLPTGNPHRLQYEQMLRTMAAALLPLQGNDGMWRSSLRDPALFPAPETSGTALITFGLAYGVRAGILDRTTYLSAVAKAWQGLSNLAIRPSGFVSGCQPPSNQPGAPYTGSAPRVASTAKSAGSLFTDESPYCIGGILLAAATVAPLFDSHPGHWGMAPASPRSPGWRMRR
jgi:rhamnogalacturonyl hydrolase YesR